MQNLLFILPEQLTTERLIVRPYKPGDDKAYYAVCLRNKAHLIPYEAGNPALEVQTLRDAQSLLREFKLQWNTRRAFFFGAWDIHTQEFIAQIYVGTVSRELPEFEIGYFVDCFHQGQGFVTEAVRAVLDFCFVQLQAHRLTIHCNELNIRSWHVAERCGFLREGHIRQQHPDLRLPDGTFSGNYVYGLLRNEYTPH